MPDLTYDDAAGGILGAPRQKTIQGASESPDQTAEAASIAVDFKLPLSVIQNDLEYYRQEALKAKNLAVIDNNKNVRNYVDNYPPAASVSNDDMLKLARASQVAGAVGKVLEFWKAGWDAVTSEHAVEAFYKGGGFTEDPIGIDPENMLKYPLLWPIQLMVAAPLDFAMRAPFGALGFVAGTASETMKNLGFDNTTARRIEREFFQVGQAFLMEGGRLEMQRPQTGLTLPQQVTTGKEVLLRQKEEARGIVVQPTPENMIAAGYRVRENYNGQPPVGAHPVTDLEKITHANVDRQALSALSEIVETTKTKERSPEAMEQFLNTQFDGVVLGVKPKELNKVLDQIEDPALQQMIGQQIGEALTTGQDVKIPLSSLFARTKPETREALLDHIRTDPNAMTVAEAAEHGADIVDHPARFRQVPFEGEPAGSLREMYGRQITETDTAIKQAEERIKTAGEAEVDQLTQDVQQLKEQRAALQTELERISAPPKAEIRFEDGMYNIYLNDALENGFGTRKDAENYLSNYHPNAYQTVLNDNIATERNVMALDPLFVGEEERPLPAPTAAKTTVEKRGEDSYFIRSTGDPSDLLSIFDDPEAVKISVATVGRQTRGKGIGTALYEAAAQFAAERGKPLRSDMSVSKDAVRVYEKLKKLGYEVTEAPDGTTSKSGKTNATAGYVYEVRMPPEKAATVEAPAKTVVAKARETHFGMSAREHAAYLKDVAEQQKAEEEAVFAAAHKAAERRQTREWKENEKQTREEAAVDLRYGRFLADDFFRTDRLPNAAERTPMKLSAEALDDNYGKGTSEQVPSYAVTKKGGKSADEVAKALGKESGQAMVEELVLLEKERRESKMKAGTFREEAIRKETEKRMTEQYGNLKENIRMEAIEALLNDIQESRLHKEIQAIAAQVGKESPWTKAELQRMAADSFDKRIMNDASVFRDFQRATGESGREAERALRTGDVEGALVAKMQQFINMLHAREAFKLQKELQSFNRIITRFDQNKVLSSISQPYTDQAHVLLRQFGFETKRDPLELAQAVKGETLEKFASGEGYGFGEIPVPDWLTPDLRTTLADLTVEQFRDLRDVFKALEGSGRRDKQYIAGQEKLMLADVKKAVIEEIEAFGENRRTRKYAEEGMRGPGMFLNEVKHQILAANLPFRTILNHISEGNPQGALMKYVIRVIHDAENAEIKLRNEVIEQMNNLSDKRGLRERLKDDHILTLIKNDMFLDRSGNGEFAEMNRKHLIKVMLNMGNDSNVRKLIEGHKLVDPAAAEFYGASQAEILEAGRNRVLDWIDRMGATKQDWELVQGIWDIFENLNHRAQEMQRRIAGVGADVIPPREVKTPHGNFKGGFIRLDYDSIRSPGAAIAKDEPINFKRGLAEEGYIRATVPHGYQKSRTGFVGALDFDLDTLPWQIKGIVHDIAFREAVMDVAKLAYDKEVRQALIKNVGKEYADLFNGWLKDIANPLPMDMDILQGVNYASAWFRQNIISMLVGLRLTTAYKHGLTALGLSADEVGSANLVKSYGRFVGDWGKLSTDTWQFMMENSVEMPNRRRLWAESLGGAHATAIGQAKNFSAFVEALHRAWYENTGKNLLSAADMMRQWSIDRGSFIVAWGDMLSAGPVWDAAYRNAMDLGRTKADAIFEADLAVIKAHGSTRATEKSAFIRKLNKSEWGRWATPLMNFFSHAMNKQIEAMWLYADSGRKLSEGEMKRALSLSYAATSKIVTALIMPAMIEELVTPLTNDERESWGKKTAKAIGRNLTAGFPIVNGFGHAFLTGHDPATGGIIGAGLKPVWEWVQHPQKTAGGDKAAHNATSALAALSGIGYAAIGDLADLYRKAASGRQLTPREVLTLRPRARRH